MTNVHASSLLRSIMEQEGVSQLDLSRVEISGSFRLSHAAEKPRLTYSNDKATQYARTYCSEEKNSCGVYLNNPTEKKSDCAHFVAHCLDSGGLTIKNTDASKTFCPKGLAVTNSDLIAGLQKAAEQYQNVQEVSCDETATGDVGFLNAIIKPSHAFLVCRRPLGPCSAADPPQVWAHTTNRCCDAMEPSWYHVFGTAFRLADG